MISPESFNQTNQEGILFSLKIKDAVVSRKLGIRLEPAPGKKFRVVMIHKNGRHEKTEKILGTAFELSIENINEALSKALLAKDASGDFDGHHVVSEFNEKLSNENGNVFSLEKAKSMLEELKLSLPNIKHYIMPIRKAA